MIPPHSDWRPVRVPVVQRPGAATLSVAVRALGPAGAPTVLCVHGLTRHGHDFDALAEAIAGSFRVLTLDLPGRGDSDWCEDARDYGDALYLDALEAIARHFDTGPLHWVGTSLGAVLGMRMAQRRPDLLRSLVLNDSGAHVDGVALTALRAGARERPGFTDAESASAYLRQRYAGFGIETDTEWKALEQHAMQRDADGLLRMRFDPRVVSDAPIPPVLDLWPQWQAVHCPVLILRGEHSRILTRETCARMVAGRPDARWIEIPGAGHAPHLAGATRIGPVAQFLHQVSHLPMSSRSNP
jgi:pimeloyl-ACP methyl ester carboxylesterase